MLQRRGNALACFFRRKFSTKVYLVQHLHLHVSMPYTKNVLSSVCGIRVMLRVSENFHSIMPLGGLRCFVPL